ncbi:hypothetical protein [Lysobacter sp. Root667]|uniref:hypothetical protein n=1 Tax=Lysobacter sp. Root667 TaxID=1736581 RepID=UPI0012DC1358|nr:hypothetical protein [Lysobacter sp. Root667]
MQRLSFNQMSSISIGLTLMSVSLPAFASGNIMLVYYAAGAALAQFALLAAVCIHWRRSRALPFLVVTYLVATAVAWGVALNMRADFYPLPVAIVVAIFPWLACFTLNADFFRKSSIKMGRG